MFTTEHKIIVLQRATVFSLHTHFRSTQAKPKENEEQVNRSRFSRRLTRGCSQAATTEGMRKPNPVQVEEDLVENNTKKTLKKFT